MRITAGTMTVGLMAIIAGLVGAYALRLNLNKEAPAPAKPALVTVPLASIDLPEGRTIALGDIGLIEMTKEELAARKYPLNQVMLNPEQIIGRTVRAGMKQGDPFLTAGLYLEGSGPDVSHMLRPGYRATTITVRDRNAVLPAQGNLVDIVFRSTAKEGKRGALDIPEATLTLLEGVEVLSVKVPRPAANNNNSRTVDLRRGQSNDQPLPVVSVAVTSDQAEVLKAVEGRGELSFAVRSAKESVAANANHHDEKLTLENLLGVQRHPDTSFTTEIYRAGDRQTLKFQRGQLIEETYANNPNRRALPATPAATPPAPVAPASQSSNSGTLPAAGVVMGSF